MKEKEKVKKYLQLQMLKEEVVELKDKKEQIERAIIELTQTNEVVENIEELKKNEIMFSVGSGLFVKGSVQTTNNVLINVGANVFLFKRSNAAKKIIHERMESLVNTYNEITSIINKVQSYIVSLEKELSR